ncbi:Vps5 like protein [Dictyocaulus viviparus]|uniref:Vps5 like protein n=1 Tax=Dictyocaulus viviparus TaxID=29172 RepID=A0A0D8XEF8_DICVI|nr:Vps5 like protein [Dictyocaulus viviparus]
MLTEDDSLRTSVGKIGNDNDSKHNGSNRPSSLLVDDGDEINLVTETQSKLRLGVSLDSGTNIPETSGISQMQPTTTATAESTTIINFAWDIRITDFERKGDGMNAYIVYKLVTKAENVPGVSDRTYEAASDPATSREVAVRRARQLERFIKRVVQHPRLGVDCDVRDFLTMETELPRSSQTSTLSGAGFKRVFKSVGDVLSKMAFHMEEGDRWFEQTQSHVEELDEHLRKLLHLSETLTSTRRELASAQENMSKGLSMLASCEESTSLARALSHLTETEENAAALWSKQSDMDSIRFTESLSEYVGLVGALKDLFAERVRVWQNWQSAKQNLVRKREQKARLELSGKNDRAVSLKDEMEEAIRRMDQLEAEFSDLSNLIHEEIGRFEVQRRHDMRQMFIDYFDSLIQTHTEITKEFDWHLPHSRVCEYSIQILDVKCMEQVRTRNSLNFRLERMGESNIKELCQHCVASKILSRIQALELHIRFLSITLYIFLLVLCLQCFELYSGVK